MARIEYDRTPVPGVTTLISVGEEPGEDSTASVLVKAALAGGAVGQTWALFQRRGAKWAALAGAGIALLWFSRR